MEFSIHKLEVKMDVHNDLYGAVFRYREVEKVQLLVKDCLWSRLDSYGTVY